MRKHYHVMQGLKGCYLPDYQVLCTSKREAIRQAKDMCEYWNSSDSDTPMYRSGSGFYQSKHHCITISEVCTDTDCRED